jgi:hypothetical protein
MPEGGESRHLEPEQILHANPDEHQLRLANPSTARSSARARLLEGERCRRDKMRLVTGFIRDRAGLLHLAADTAPQIRELKEVNHHQRINYRIPDF